MKRRVSEGSPEPLGLTLDKRGANVRRFFRSCHFD